MDERMAEIGERIRAARRRKKISQTNFGKLVGRSMNGMAMIERGEADPPVGLLMRIAETLEEDFEFLVTGRRKARIIADLTVEELDELMQRMEARRNQYHKDQGNPDYVGHTLTPEVMAGLQISDPNDPA